MSSFEKIQAGDNVPLFERVVDTEQLVRYAGASGDFSRQHWDHEYMVNQGFPGVIVHGWLTFAIMCEAVARWIPPESCDGHGFHGPLPSTALSRPDPLRRPCREHDRR